MTVPPPPGYTPAMHAARQAFVYANGDHSGAYCWERVVAAVREADRDAAYDGDKAVAAELVAGLDANHGHAWRVTVEGVTASRVVGDPDASFAEFVGEPWQVIVQAHNLRDALFNAGRTPLEEWAHGDDSDGGSFERLAREQLARWQYVLDTMPED